MSKNTKKVDINDGDEFVKLEVRLNLTTGLASARLRMSDGTDESRENSIFGIMTLVSGIVESTIMEEIMQGRADNVKCDCPKCTAQREVEDGVVFVPNDDDTPN